MFFLKEPYNQNNGGKDGGNDVKNISAKSRSKRPARIIYICDVNKISQEGLRLSDVHRFCHEILRYSVKCNHTRGKYQEAEIEKNI